MTNPLDQFRSQLFGSRGCDIALALQYVDELAAASSDAVAVQTAARVLLNTAANAVHQVMSAPSPERLALIELIDERIKATSWDKFVLEENINDKISDWMDSNVDHDHLINEWMSDNFDVTDYNFNDAVDRIIGDAVSEWMNDNLADKIQDLDLVVRLR